MRNCLVNEVKKCFSTLFYGGSRTNVMVEQGFEKCDREIQSRGGENYNRKQSHFLRISFRRENNATLQKLQTHNHVDL